MRKRRISRLRGKRIETRMLKKDWQHLRCEQKGSRTKKFVKKPASTRNILFITQIQYSISGKTVKVFY